VSDAVETLVMPLSGWVFQWRSDGWWRELSTDQHRDEAAGVRLVTAWAPTWWLVYGKLSDTGSPSVVLDDGRQPDVVTLGRLGISEWQSIPQAATVSVGESEWVVPFERRPAYPPSRGRR
jgi:hypothetical protein